MLMSDNGPQYISSVLKKLAELLGTKQVFSAKYASWQNGLAERKFKSLKKLLRLTCSRSPNLWSERLPSIMFAMNKSYNRSIQCSYLKMLYGHAPVPLLPEITLTDMDNLISDVLVKRDLTYVREAAKDREAIYIEKENARNTKNRKDDKFSIGELVLKSPYRLGFTAPKKHVALFTGPWKVIG